MDLTISPEIESARRTLARFMTDEVILRESNVERVYRMVRILTILEGTSEMQRATIAKRVLKGRSTLGHPTANGVSRRQWHKGRECSVLSWSEAQE